MNTVQRIAKNTGVLFVSQVISYLLGFFYMMYTARYLKAEGFGILSFALAFTGIFGVLADFGLVRLIVREVARDKSLAPKYLANISAMKVILAIITFGLIALVVNLLGYPQHTVKAVYLIALSVILTAFTRMLYSIFQAFEKMEYQSLGQILHGVLMLLGVIVAIKFHFSVVGFAFIYSITSFMVLGYSYVILRWKFNKPVFASATRILEIDWSFWKPTIKSAWVFAVGNFFVSIYFMIDRVMLSKMKGDDVVGYYSAAYNLINVLSVVPLAFSTSLFPVMSNYFKTSQSSLNKIYQYSVRYMYLLAMPITIGTVLLSKRIIYMVYEDEFLPSTRALNVLIFAEFFVFVDIVLGHMLVSIGKEKVNMFNAGAGALLNVVLNLLLIPKMGFVGAGIATVITVFYFFVSSSYALSKAQYKLNFAKIIPIPVLATLLMGGLVYYLGQAALFIVIPVSAVIYFTILYITNYISKEDITLIKKALKLK
ncbi:MAG: flippase [Planctomycetota bacterium]|jgi:O-antigen/teichoic acid export membrane protein